MNSLYELDPKWQKLLTKDNFLGGLTVNEFVQELSQDHALRIPSKGLLSEIRYNSNINNSGSRSGSNIAIQGDEEVTTWDPKPFIRTFESTLKELKFLHDQSQNERMVLANNVTRQELEHSYKVKELADMLNNITTKYSNLDSKLSNVTQVVKPLGDKLEISIRRKKIYTKSIELIKIYNEYLNDGDSSILKALFLSNDLSDQLQSAMVMKNLINLTKKIETQSIPRTVDTTKLIELSSEKMETNWLEQFNMAYRDNDFNKLNEIAMILNQFNGSVNVISNFINQHEFFIDSNQIDIDIDNNDSLMNDNENNKSLNDPDYHHVIFNEKIVTLLENITNVIKNESQIVTKVFDKKSTYVLQLFIQRVFVQKLEPKVDAILNDSLNWSNIAYVRNLHSLHSQIGQFIKNLSTFFQKDMNSNDIGSKSNSGNNQLISTLEQCFSDLFTKYLYDKSRYFDLEKRNLETILMEKTNEFNIINDKNIRPRLLTNKLNKNLENGIELTDSSMVNLNEPNNVNTNNSFSNKTRQAGSRISQYKNIIKKRLDFDGFNKFDNNNEDGQLDAVRDHFADNQLLYNIENVDSMLKCVVESVARVMELVPNKANEYNIELIEIMFMGIIGSYIDSALEIAYANINRTDLNTEMVNLSNLYYVSASTDIINYISVAIKSVFLPLLNNSPNIKKNLIELTNGNIKKCEFAINIIMEKLIKLISNRFSNVLLKQKKKDFLPKTQDMIDQDTLPAIEIVNELNYIHSQVIIYLKAKNLESFLVTVGENLYNLLVVHYGKFQVSSTGGIIVTKDIIGYLNVIETWNIGRLFDKFSTLRELANLFTVQPELLDSLTKEGHLVDVDRNVFQTYIANREDFNNDNFITSMKNNLKQYT